MENLGTARKRLSMTARSAFALVAVAFLSTMVASLSTGTATARPENCNDTIDSRNLSVSTVCSSGSGQHQAVAVCEDGATGERSWEYGPWADAQTVSTAYCRGSLYVVSSGLNTKN